MIRIVLSLVLTVLTAGAWAQTLPHPAVTNFKTDVCSECGMNVDSKSYAAQIVTAGKPLFFDDIGCLVTYEKEGKIKAVDVKARYVRSVAGDAWVAVEKAVWVLVKEVRTPMGYGFHAFADQKDAEAFAKGKKDAKILLWKDLPTALPAEGGSMGKM